MIIEQRGQKPSAYLWSDKSYGCPYCKSTIRLTSDDARFVIDDGERLSDDGRWVKIICPVCEEERVLTETKSLTSDWDRGRDTTKDAAFDALLRTAGTPEYRDTIAAFEQEHP